MPNISGNSSDVRSRFITIFPEGMSEPVPTASTPSSAATASSLLGPKHIEQPAEHTSSDSPKLSADTADNVPCQRAAPFPTSHSLSDLLV